MIEHTLCGLPEYIISNFLSRECHLILNMMHVESNRNKLINCVVEDNYHKGVEIKFATNDIVYKYEVNKSNIACFVCIISYKIMSVTHKQKYVVQS